MEAFTRSSVSYSVDGRHEEVTEFLGRLPLEIPQETQFKSSSLNHELGEICDGEFYSEFKTHKYHNLRDGPRLTRTELTSSRLLQSGDSFSYRGSRSMFHGQIVPRLLSSVNPGSVSYSTSTDFGNPRDVPYSTSASFMNLNNVSSENLINALYDLPPSRSDGSGHVLYPPTASMVQVVPDVRVLIEKKRKPPPKSEVEVCIPLKYPKVSKTQEYDQLSQWKKRGRDGFDTEYTEERTCHLNQGNQEVQHLSPRDNLSRENGGLQYHHLQNGKEDVRLITVNTQVKRGNGNQQRQLHDGDDLQRENDALWQLPDNSPEQGNEESHYLNDEDELYDESEESCDSSSDDDRMEQELEELRSQVAQVRAECDGLRRGINEERIKEGRMTLELKTLKKRLGI